ncbi:MAG TPA: hypothetical protein VMZ53_00705 [Kofleriaceae bacterium]|nr:hypothetical protein [Kofleriaceae bacterium]
MRTSISLAFLLATAAAAAPTAGCGTDSTVSGVFPAEGFTGRSLRVEISGDATEWSGSPAVNFGQGVTVSSVSVASPTSLFADITIAADAAPGLRDVTITNDGTFTLKQSFELVSPITVSFDGMVAQGGSPYFTVTNHDFDTPFDLTSGDTPSGFANLTLDTPAGTQFVVQDSTPYQLTGFALIDADAAPGTFSLSSGVMGKETAFNLGANIDITARTPTPLTDSATGTLASMGDSALYSVNVATAPSLMRIVADTSDADGQPVTAVLPNGSWADATGAALSVQATSGTLDVVVFDAGKAGGYSYTLKSKIEALASAAEATTANDTPAAALAASALPFAQTGGTLSGTNDKDVIKIVLSAPAVVHVSAHSSDDLTDTAIDILANGSGNPTVLTNYVDPGPPAQPPVDLGGCFPLFGLGCGEDITSPMLAAGTYFVVISAGGSFDVADKNYTALIYLN